MATGFAPSTEVYEFVCSGKSGRMLTITCACDKKRTQQETDIHAYGVAAKIFNLIINPEDETAETLLYQEFDYNMVCEVKELHQSLEIDPNDPWLKVLIKRTKQKEWVKLPLADGMGVSRVELATSAAVRDRPNFMQSFGKWQF